MNRVGWDPDEEFFRGSARDAVPVIRAYCREHGLEVGEVIIFPTDGPRFRYWRSEPPMDPNDTSLRDVYDGLPPDIFDEMALHRKASRRRDPMSVAIDDPRLSGNLRVDCPGGHDLLFSVTDLRGACRRHKYSTRAEKVFNT